MLNQNVAKVSPPSYSQVRSNMPMHYIPDHWKGVYYFSGISNQMSRARLMNKKVNLVKNTTKFNDDIKHLVQLGDLTVAKLRAAATTTSPAVVSPGAASSPLVDAVRKVILLADHGLVDEAAGTLDIIYQTGSLSSSVSVADIADIVASFGCPKLRAHILRTEADGDIAMSYKLVGDHKAEQRASEARKWFERGVEKVQATYKKQQLEGGAMAPTGAAARVRQASLQRLFAALMAALLTCGFDRGVHNIPNSVYDTMGTLGVQPTVEHYHHVTLALALSADIQQLRSVTDFALRHMGSVLPRDYPSSEATAAPNSQAQSALLPFYDHLLLGYREARDYEACSQVWEELLGKRFPRPSPQTADLYIRSIIDHGYTRVSDQNIHFGELHMVEHKRIPLEVSKLDQLGIPRSHLTQSVQDHVEDALRKYSIHKSRFYQWGRAVKQFDFIEFRRKNGWLYDLREMTPVTSFSLTPRRLPWQDPDEEGNITSAGAVEIPSFMSDTADPSNRPWEFQALSHVMNVSKKKELMHDTKAADYFTDEITPIHERGPGWSNRVPQTRYNNLYSLNAPNVPKIGIRRHIEAERAYSGALRRDGDVGSALPISAEEQLQRDAGLMRSVVSTARRQRQRAAGSSTHRESVL